ncbi:MAG: hypothetical protein R2705_14985 [Ilumatobacteraceae bacterium]
MGEAPPLPGTMSLDIGALGQLSYHLQCAAALSADGASDQAAGHTLLSWALLDALGGAALTEAVDALDLPRGVGDLRASGATRVRAHADELGLQLLAHFTSEGRHDLASLYREACDRMVTATRPD